MNRVLIVKIGATGDVVRTTPILRMLNGEITWITDNRNLELIAGIAPSLKVLPWEERDRVVAYTYDLVINLEDSKEVAEFLEGVSFERNFGAFKLPNGELGYTDSSSAWFDLSLISKHGRGKADRLKLDNRRTYQELLFEGLGWKFEDQRYLLPATVPTDLRGDIAIAPKCGPVWPIKNWPYFDELKIRLEDSGYRVNYLPNRASLIEHLSDIEKHALLISGDSLPMHLALGLGVPTLSLFTCTSPWEIHGYGIQKKLVSPLLAEFFYQRKFDERGITSISVDTVYHSALELLADRYVGADL